MAKRDRVTDLDVDLDQLDVAIERREHIGGLAATRLCLAKRGSGGRCRRLDDDLVGARVAAFVHGDFCLGGRGQRCGSDGRLFLQRQSDLGAALEESDALVQFHVFAGDNRGGDEEFVFVRDLDATFLQRGLGLGECVGSGFERVAVERRQLELVGSDFYDLRVGGQRRLAKIAENRLAKTGVNLLPAAVQHVVERLQPILLAAGSDARPAAAGAHDLGELGKYGTIFVEDAGRLHHVDVRADRAARHREADHAGVGRGGDRVKLVLAQALVQQRLDFVHLRVVDVEAVAGALERVGHRADVRLRRAGSQRPHGEVDSIDTPVDAGHVTGDGRGGGVVRVLNERNLRRQNRLDALGRLVTGARGGRAGGVLEADRVEVDVALEQFADDVDVKFRRVRLVGLERQPHQRDANLVVHPGIDDRLAGLDQVADVVHEVEIAVDRRAVLLHQLSLQREGGGALRVQRDAGD